MKLRNIGVHLVLSVVIASFLAALCATRPAARFGQFYDDTMYMSVGKALAKGDGFVMPSLPGTPPQTKYPILYPWLLSWVWHWAPDYPRNVGVAAALTATAACWYLIATFLLLRRWPGIGNWIAIAIVSACAFHRSFLFQSGQVTTEIPFAALMMSALLCAEVGSEKGGASWWLWLAGVFAGLGVLTRTAGIAVPAGIGLYFLYRRCYKDFLRVALSAAPFVVGAAAWNIIHRQVIPPDAPVGWVQTWLFYTSYVEFWLLSIKTPQVFLKLIASNADAVFMQISKLTLMHDLGTESLLTRALAFTLSVGILAGIVRFARRDEWRPIHFVFAVTTITVISWSWSIAGRVLVPFLPLLYVGLITEMQHLWRALVEPFRSASSLHEKILASVLCIPLAWLLGTGLMNYVRGTQPNGGSILLGERSAKDWAELSAWVEEHLSRDTVFLADLDTRLYLETGHQAITPMVLTDNLYYDPDAPESRAQFAHFMDVARHLKIGYWVVDGRVRATNMREWDDLVSTFQRELPEVFRTRSGALRILDTTCIVDNDWNMCGNLLKRLARGDAGSRTSTGPPGM